LAGGEGEVRRCAWPEVLEGGPPGGMTLAASYIKRRVVIIREG